MPVHEDAYLLGWRLNMKLTSSDVIPDLSIWAERLRG
jgi:hypothetical protein